MTEHHDRVRVLLVSRPTDLAHRPYDGFARRHVDIATALAARFDVVLCLLGDEADAVDPRLRDLPTVSAPLPESAPPSRVGRLRRAVDIARSSHFSAAEQELRRFILDTDAAVVVTVGPWLDAELRACHGLVPSLHLFEEDLTRMRELAPQSSQAKVMRAVEHWLHSRTSLQPSVVVSIAPTEVGFAKRRYPRADHHVLPYFLPSDQEPLRVDRHAPGDYVFVPGVLAEERNAEGLAEVLALMETDGPTLPVLLSSATGYHSCLRKFLTAKWITTVDPGQLSLAECYDRARVVLIPAKRLTGTKTTLLEAWSARRPVVCSSAVAAPVGASRDACAVGRSADEMRRKVAVLWESDELRRELVDAGSAAASKRDREALVGGLIDMLISLTSRHRSAIRGNT